MPLPALQHPPVQVFHPVILLIINTLSVRAIDFPIYCMPYVSFSKSTFQLIKANILGTSPAKVILYTHSDYINDHSYVGILRLILASGKDSFT